MSFKFNPNRGLIQVRVEVWGPNGTAVVVLALDTGATGTVISQTRMLQLGYDPTAAQGRVRITTGSGVAFVPRLPVARLFALGRERVGFPVLCHTFPPSATIDGVLGLDFFRGEVLTLDFRNGSITLA